MSRILIVEDEEKLRRIIAHQFRHDDFDVLEAEDAEEAVKILQDRQEQIDLVILDLLLKEITGAFIFDFLRKRYPKIKVVVSSIFDKTEQMLFVDRADGYYCKMDDLSELKYKVKSLLSINEIDAG